MNQPRIVNDDVTEMIIRCINHLGFKIQVECLNQLSDGDHLSRLVACFLKDESIIDNLDAIKRFEYIERFIKDKCNVHYDVSYDDARGGNEFELAKIAINILLQGFKENKERFQSLESHAKFLSNYYELLNRGKLKTLDLCEQQFQSKPKDEVTKKSGNEYKQQFEEVVVDFNTGLSKNESIIKELKLSLSEKGAENESNIEKYNFSEVDGQREANEYRGKIEELTSAFEFQLNEFKEQKETESRQYEQVIASLESQLSDSKSRYDELVTEFSAANERIGELSEQLNQKCAENESNVERYNTSETERQREAVEYQQQIKELNHHLVKTINKLNAEFTANLNQKEREVTEYQAKIESIETAWGEWKTSFDDIVAQLITANDKIDTLSTHLSETCAESESYINNLEQKENDLQREIAAYQQQLEELNSKMSKTVDELNVANELKMSELKGQKAAEAVEFQAKILSVEATLSEVQARFNETVSQLGAANEKISEMSKHLTDKCAENAAYMNRFNENELEKQRTLASHQQHIEELNSNTNKTVTELNAAFESKFNELKTQKETAAVEYQGKICSMEALLNNNNANLLEEDRREVKNQLEATKKENDQLKRGYTELKEHLKKFEDHYNKKKQMYQESEANLAEAIKKLDQYEERMQQQESTMKELMEKNAQAIQEYEQLNEHHKAATNENHTLNASVDYLERKLKALQALHDQSTAHAGPKPTLSSSHKENWNKISYLYKPVGSKTPTLLKTQKCENKFFDDSKVKYSTQNEFFGIKNQYGSDIRRQTMETAGHGCSNSLNVDQSIRVYNLKTRNLQQQPHLKSSYPLEPFNLDVSEDQIREGKQQHQREKLKEITNLSKK